MSFDEAPGTPAHVEEVLNRVLYGVNGFGHVGDASWNSPNVLGPKADLIEVEVYEGMRVNSECLNALRAHDYELDSVVFGGFWLDHPDSGEYHRENRP